MRTSLVQGISYPWQVLFTVSMGTAMTTLDASIITIAFPELIRAFQADLPAVMWVTLAYVLVSSSLMLLFGKLSDFVGRKRIYTAGFGIFTLAMAACSLAQCLEQLILFRVLQGVGAAMVIGCSTAIVTAAFPGNKMGKGLGLLGVAVSAGFITGPVAGGFLLEYFDWRAIFYTRVPLSLLALVLSVVLLRKDTVQTGKINLDLWGAMASFAGLFCFLLGMGKIKMYGLKSPEVLLLAGTGMVLLCLLPLIERRAQNPIIDFALFQRKDFTCAMAGSFVFFLTMPVYLVILPFYFIEGIRLSAADSGLLLSVIPLTTMLASPVGGALTDRFGPRWPATLGAGAVVAALFGLSRFNLQTELGTIIGVLALLGLASGIFQPPNNSAIMSAVPLPCHGAASAMLATNRQVAMSIGLALTGVVFSTRQMAYRDFFLQAGFDASQAFRQSIPQALEELMLVSFFLALTMLLFSVKPPDK
ncbi:MAG TPA: MFS transporter [Patescibacteria group bacterium]|nr:MFS transporter [Patescibacteria group bacterium]